MCRVMLIEYLSHPGFPHALVMTFLFSHKPCILFIFPNPSPYSRHITDACRTQVAGEDQGYLDRDTHTRDKSLQVCNNLQVTPHLTEETQRRQRKRPWHFCCWRIGGMVGIWGENTGKFELGCGKKVGSKFLLTMFLLTLIKTRSTSKWSSTSYPVLSFLSFLDFTTLHHHPKHLSNPSLTLSHHSLLPRRTQSPSHQPNYPLPFSPHWVGRRWCTCSDIEEKEYSQGWPIAWVRSL